MTRFPRLPIGLSGPIALLAVVAIASGGWSAYGITSSGGATTARPQVNAGAHLLHDAAALRASARDAGWEERSAPFVQAAPADTGSGATAPTSKRSTHAVLGARASSAPDLAPAGAARTFAGTDHFWIPSLGMSFSVRPYACGRTSNPGNYMYRWGCAGANNVYILGHAYSVMKPLHDLYVRGGLHVGMVALYADGAGRIRAYQVTEWRVARPTEIAWQIASQPVPSMTLQTCLGANSQYRLNVRLVSMS